MMTFYCAVGSYRLKIEQGHKVPYIQKLGVLHPISTLEFLIWTTLLWEIMTYQELKEAYVEQCKGLGMDTPALMRSTICWQMPLSFPMSCLVSRRLPPLLSYS